MVHEAVLALFFHHFDARRQHGIVGRRERQLVDDHQRERIAAHVDAFPEALAADQHAIPGGAELVQQFRAALVALHEQGEVQAPLLEFVGQALGGPLDGAQGGAQEEGAPARRLDDGQGAVDDGVRVAQRIRLRQVLRHEQQALLAIVEGARPGVRRFARQAHLFRKMLEVVFHGQGGGRENPAARRAFALVVEDRRDRQWCFMQLQGAGKRLHPEHGFFASRDLGLRIELPAAQLLRQLDAAHAALFQRFRAFRLGFQHGHHAVELIFERVQRRKEITRRGDLRQGQAHDVLREGQTQVARRLFHHRHRLGPVDAARMRQALGQHVAAQFQDLRGRHRVAKEQSGRIGQLVCLIEDDGIGRRQQFGHARVLQGHVGKEQMVVDNHHVGLLGFLAGFHDEAILVILALGAHAGVARGRHQIPDHGVFRHLGQFRLVAGAGHLDEARDFAQMPHVVARRHAPVLQGAFQVIVADVVRAALQQGHGDRCLQRGAHGGDIAQEQLVLQVLRAGRHDGLAAPHQGRHQVGESFTRARARLGDQGGLAVDGVGDGLGHFRLRTARLVAAHGGTERAARAEQALDVGIVLARGRLGFGWQTGVQIGRLAIGVCRQ